MGLGSRESEHEAARKRAVHVRWEKERIAAEKELHYIKLKQENENFKRLLRLAVDDMGEWIYCKGENTPTQDLIDEIQLCL